MRTETKIDNNKKINKPPKKQSEIEKRIGKLKSKGDLSFVYVPQKDTEVGHIRAA